MIKNRTREMRKISKNDQEELKIEKITDINTKKIQYLNLFLKTIITMTVQEKYTQMCMYV